MIQRLKRLSSSPLIDPAICAIVLIAPTQQELASVSRRVRTSTQHNLGTVIAAAQIINVPLLLSSPGPEPGRHGLAKKLPRGLPHREFVSGTPGLAWQDPAFSEALAAEDRPVLVLAGFWLEHQILSTALHALANSYDVYVLLDASPARARPAVLLSQNRLIQAGATPVVTSQVIHEWSLSSVDVAKRAALWTLVSPSFGTDANA